MKKEVLYILILLFAVIVLFVSIYALRTTNKIQEQCNEQWIKYLKTTGCYYESFIPKVMLNESVKT